MVIQADLKSKGGERKKSREVATERNMVSDPSHRDLCDLSYKV